MCVWWIFLLHSTTPFFFDLYVCNNKRWQFVLFLCIKWKDFFLEILFPETFLEVGTYFVNNSRQLLKLCLLHMALKKKDQSNTHTHTCLCLVVCFLLLGFSKIRREDKPLAQQMGREKLDALVPEKKTTFIIHLDLVTS